MRKVLALLAAASVAGTSLVLVTACGGDGKISPPGCAGYDGTYVLTGSSTTTTCRTEQFQGLRPSLQLSTGTSTATLGMTTAGGEPLSFTGSWEDFSINARAYGQSAWTCEAPACNPTKNCYRVQWSVEFPPTTETDPCKKPKTFTGSWSVQVQTNGACVPGTSPCAWGQSITGTRP